MERVSAQPPKLVDASFVPGQLLREQSRPRVSERAYPMRTATKRQINPLGTLVSRCLNHSTAARFAPTTEQADARGETAELDDGLTPQDRAWIADIPKGTFR
jgi:hypothetical protein